MGVTNSNRLSATNSDAGLQTMGGVFSSVTPSARLFPLLIHLRAPLQDIDVGSLLYTDSDRRSLKAICFITVESSVLSAECNSSTTSVHFGTTIYSEGNN